MIKLENVNKYFGSHHVLKDVNLTVQEGEKLVIIGLPARVRAQQSAALTF